MQYTDEQLAIINAAKTGESLKVVAYAGSGKTTTLVGVARALRGKRIIYVAFNKATATEGVRAFGSFAQSKTAHALAYRSMASWISTKTLSPAWQLKTIVEAKASREIAAAAMTLHVPYNAVVTVVIGIITQFCLSDAENITTAAIPYDWYSAHHDREHYTDAMTLLIDGANTVWNWLMRSLQRQPITHDIYLKRWALTHPKLPYDVILFDEAQDANPVLHRLLSDQRHAQIIWVGDPHQQIYQWRGAVNAMKNVSQRALPLSKSWRFGEAIADVANVLLTGCFHIDIPIQSNDTAGKVILHDEPMTKRLMVKTVICRTNKGVLDVALDSLHHKVPTAIVGGANSIASLLEAMLKLYQGRKTTHPDLVFFTSWNDMEMAIENGDTGGWQALAKLVKNETEKIPSYCAELRLHSVEEDAASLIVTTAHKAKGREWDYVVLYDDFPPCAVEKDGEIHINAEEARLQYVAVTRAIRYLDLRAAKTFQESLNVLTKMLAKETAQ